jgi:hypothetical protein
MSDIKTTREMQFMIEQMAQKINKAPALNGGFDRMLVMVEHIQEAQEESAKKLNDLHQGLYEPNDGLYARVKSVETFMDNSNKIEESHFKKDEENLANVKKSLDALVEKDAEIEKLISDKLVTTKKLKTIAGENLEELETFLKFKKIRFDIISKISWLLIGGFVAAIVKSLWERIGAN